MIPKKVNSGYNARHKPACKDTIGGIKSIRVMSLEEASKEFPDIDFGVKSISLVNDPLPEFKTYNHQIDITITPDSKL